jgi:hypothetical protein
LQGLEIEVQRLINRHRAELESAHERAAEQVKAALEGAKVEQGAQLELLRDKLRKVSSSNLARVRALMLCAQSDKTRPASKPCHASAEPRLLGFRVHSNKTQPSSGSAVQLRHACVRPASAGRRNCRHRARGWLQITR